MASLLKTDGTSELITEPFSLSMMQRLVGGYIEYVTLAGTPQRREVLIVDEAGLLKDKPVNGEATQLFRYNRNDAAAVIVGDVIHCIVTNEGAESEAYE